MNSWVLAEWAGHYLLGVGAKITVPTTTVKECVYVCVCVCVCEHWPWLNRVNVVVCEDAVKYMYQHSLPQLITSSIWCYIQMDDHLLLV